MKGQVALEYIIIVGVVLAILIPFVLYATRESGQSTQVESANNAVNLIGNAAERVFALGPGSKDSATVIIPNGVNQSLVANHTILLQIYVYGGYSDIFKDTKAEVIGFLPKRAGNYRIFFNVLENGVVNITY